MLVKGLQFKIKFIMTYLCVSVFKIIFLTNMVKKNMVKNVFSILVLKKITNWYTIFFWNLLNEKVIICLVSNVSNFLFLNIASG